LPVDQSRERHYRDILRSLGRCRPITFSATREEIIPKINERTHKKSLQICCNPPACYSCIYVSAILIGHYVLGLGLCFRYVMTLQRILR